MSVEQARYSLIRLKRRYISLRSIEIALLMLATFLLTKAIAGLLETTTNLVLLLSVVAGLSVGIIRIAHYRLFNLDTTFFTSYLNKTYPSLKESADLIIRDESELTLLQQIQKIKTLQQFDAIYPEIKLPHHILQSAGIMAGCGLVYFLTSSFSSPLPDSKQNDQSGLQSPSTIRAAIDTTTAHIKALTIRISPPAYTALKPSVVRNGNLSFPEGSLMNLAVEFNREVSEAKIIFSGRDSINLTSGTNQKYTLQKTISESGFYQVQWNFKNEVSRSDYYKIEVIKDEPPKVSITNLEQFTKLRFDEDLAVKVNSSLADDYGLQDGQIIATVSKGSGESVKFREEKLRFTTPKQISGKQVNASITLDLMKLGLEPGDELYFYVEALDNKMPVANRQRTETFFIALQDTTTEITTMDDGLGVDLLPEYFRSQRQIIIETEKLLKDKKNKKVSTKEFNVTSNELGYDQKVLRLRYGQFMGEEADSGIGTEAAAEAVEESKHEKDEKDILSKFGHAHDTENEHNLVDQKKEPGHDHNKIKDPEETEDPMKAFMHQHDNSEEATFLFQSVRAKLKAALSIMWDAELHLRLFDPAKSLPYQYKALNLLKEISNDNRIYVARSGFDPPPLKEEKRLTADLTEVKTQTNKSASESPEKFPGIRVAILLTEKMLTEDILTSTTESQKIFNKAGQELAGEAIEQPGVYLKGLSLLKLLTSDKLSQQEIKRALLEDRPILWRVLPVQSSSPSARKSAVHSLDNKFLHRIDKMKE